MFCIPDDCPRFWSKVAICAHIPLCSTCCWIWQAKISHRGYGCYNLTHKKQVHAHRYAWERLHGQSMAPEYYACHQCHNTRCVNPLHIYAGTPHQNMQHSYKDKRLKMGETHSISILNDHAIRQIRTMQAQGISQKTIAQQFSVSQGHISRIIRYKSWRHI